MPVKIWEKDKRGLSSRVVTGWDTVLTAEEHREDAENLDRAFDAILDNAVTRLKEKSMPGVAAVFIRAWAVGNAFRESKLLASPLLKKEEASLLWKALVSKLRTGARANGQVETAWLELRTSLAREPRREGKNLDYFGMCIWLAEQDLQDAVDTFGGSIRNVWQMLERPALRPIALRRALEKWLGSQPKLLRQKLFEPAAYAEMMKALRRRWPARGPGSAKRPVHYKDTDLFAEVEKLLTPFALEPSEGPSSTKPVRKDNAGKKNRRK